MRRKVIAASLAACFAAVLCMGTWALFTATGTATNVVTVGDVSIRLVEDFDELGAQGIVPGRRFMWKTTALILLGCACASTSPRARQVVRRSKRVRWVCGFPSKRGLAPGSTGETAGSTWCSRLMEGWHLRRSSMPCL